MAGNGKTSCSWSEEPSDSNEIDHSKFPTGSVLDIVIHPSAVSGDDGLLAFYGILMTYFKKGGFAMHGNVFNVETLKEAQKKCEEMYLENLNK